MVWQRIENRSAVPIEYILEEFNGFAVDPSATASTGACDRDDERPQAAFASAGFGEADMTLRKTVRWTRHVLIDAWPSAVFIAALVGIIHSHFHWLDGIDGYAFGVVSTLSQMADRSGNERGSGHDTDPRVWLFSIDEQMFETRYFGRTPLDRCQLSHDLESVYERIRRHNAALVKVAGERPSRIDVMAIDLDLSPVISRGEGDPRTAPEKACQQRLDDLLRSNAGPDAEGGEAIRTIVLTPFDAGSNRDSTNWQDTMHDVVSFGDPDLRIEHGMAFRYACDPASLAAMAYRATHGDRHGCIERALEESGVEEARYQPIDPHAYLAQIDLVGWDDGNTTPADLSRSSGPGTADSRIRAAFFGVSFGADQFLTPIGKLSGVEVHAGSYLSLLDPVTSSSEWQALGADVVIGLLFGLLIKCCWAGFFHGSVDADATKRTFAAKWLVGLCATFIVVSLGLIYVSSQLFHIRAWLSPLPMGIGMLFDGMVLAPVDHAMESSGHDKTFFESVRNMFGREAFALMEDGYRWTGLGKLSFTLLWWLVVLIALLME